MKETLTRIAAAAVAAAACCACSIPQPGQSGGGSGFEIGTQAPEIEGEDIDGVPFKLSDYRGKVVVLDFWGDW